MTTGQLTCYSVDVERKQYFGGSHEHPFSAGREKAPGVFVYAGRICSIHDADAVLELYPYV